MKKIKLRGKELKRIGFTNDSAVSLAINLVAKNYRRSDKMEVLELLGKINLTPEDYFEDPVFGQLAKLLSEKTHPQKKKKKPVLNKQRWNLKFTAKKISIPRLLSKCKRS